MANELDVTVPEEHITNEELEEVLKFTYEEEDWDKGGPCKTLYELGNSFASKEDAQKTINRILTALKRIRN